MKPCATSIEWQPARPASCIAAKSLGTGWQFRAEPALTVPGLLAEHGVPNATMTDS